ncbi:hypothetical protein CQW23_18418 [Capsicum baccatum]|uniref:BEN domain-containing protein n=1 Tax=Capsicum baccatum TaxID=33114 RepID=A0A2G2W2W3_CAPBA|nr:hypothetical protein CQW23_18418 [Capsicum baccatum]
MDSSSKRTSIAEALVIFKEKLKEEHYSFVQRALMKCEKSFKEEKRRMEETYNQIIEDHRRYYKNDNDLLSERIEEIENATSESVNCYAEKLRELRDEVSLMVENERKNDEDLVVETDIQATGENGDNNVESSQGEDRAIVLFDDPKSVGTSTGNSSGQSRLKDKFRTSAYNLLADPSACKAIVLSEASDEPETMLVCTMNDNDDELTLTEIARASKSRGQKKEVHVKGSSNSSRKRKRSMNEGQITSFVPELVNPGNKSGIEWSSEDDFCSAFYTDAELCLNAVCALYRRQISGNKFSSMSKIDKNRITALGVFLCRGDPENKLKRTISDVGPEDLCICKTLAIRYFRQIYRIYNSKKDQLFCAGAAIRKLSSS